MSSTNWKRYQVGRGSRPVLGLATLLLARAALGQDPPAEGPTEVDDEISELEEKAAEGQPPEPGDAATAEAPAEAAPAEEAPATSTPAEVPAVSETAAAGGEAADSGDVVMVTADRRKKDLQDYAGVVSAFAESKLTRVGVNDVRDLAVMVPGLQIGTQESGTAIFIRGIGSDNFTELGDSAVALHVDGVYMPRPRGLGQMFFDIARVEVNSGPQGTLRGRNAVGGSVNIISNQPKLGQFESNAQVTLATYNERAYQAMVNIPIGDTVALRVAGTSLSHDPYWENAGPLTDIKGAQSADNWAMRGIVKWQPTQPLEISLTYDYLTERSTGYLGAQFINELNRVDADGNPDPVDPNSVDNPRRIYQRGWFPDTTMWHRGVRGNVTYDAGPVIFEAMGSYRDQDYKQRITYPPNVILPTTDVGAINPDSFGGQQWHNTSKATIFELRASAPDDARLRWSAGAFYFREDQGAFLGQVRDPAGGYGGGEFNMPSTIGTSYAGYADATFDVQEDFRVLGGIRLTKDYKERTGGLWAIWVNTGGLGRFATEGFNYKGFDRADYGIPGPSTQERVDWFLDGIQSFGARDEAPQRLCNDPLEAAEGEEQEPRLFLNEDGNLRCTRGARDTLPNGIFNVVQQDYNVPATYVDWRAGVEYDLSPDSLLYLTATTGHKAAGFNDTLFVGDETFNSDYGTENLLSFELGSKNLLADRKLRLNAGAFFFTYGSQQFQTIVAVGDPPPRDPETGMILVNPETDLPFEDTRSGSAVRQNAQEQTNVYGLDLDVIYALPAGLEAEVHALVMDARYSDGTYVKDTRLDPGAVNTQVDLGGNWLPRASAFTINYTLSQLLFTDAGSFDWVIQGQTRGTHYMTVYNGDGKGLLAKGPDWEPEFDNNANYQFLLENPARLTDVVPTYTTINLGVGWRHPDGRLSLRGYVNNALDVTYATFIGATGGNNIRFYNNQRMGGVRLRLDW